MLLEMIIAAATEVLEGAPEDVTAGTLFREASKGCVVWRGHGSDLYADIKYGGQTRSVLLPSTKFEAWLRVLFHALSNGNIPTEACIQRVVNMFMSQAAFTTRRQTVYNRVGFYDNALYIDMANEPQTYIKVTVAGWEIVKESPIKFVRGDYVGELPVPKRTEKCLKDLIAPFVAPKAQEKLPLIVGYLLGLVMPEGPYPVLVVTGQHGAAKSTMVKLLRAIVDPHTLDMRAPFKDERDFVAAVKNGYCLAFDNVSYIPNWLSDSLCALATGDRALGGRTLYKDHDESAFWAVRPILCNGIPEFVRRPDLVDRIIRLDFPRLTSYKPTRAFWNEFKEAHPEVLGALLDVAVQGLARLEGTEAPVNIRMSGFAQWVIACETAAGFQGGEFMGQLMANKHEANETVLEFSSTGLAIILMLQDLGRFYGTYRELKNEILKYAYDTKKIPDNNAALVGEIKTLVPALTAMDIMIKFHGRTNERGVRRGQSVIELERIDEKVQPEQQNNTGS